MVELGPDEWAMLEQASAGKIDITWGHPTARRLAYRSLVTLRRFERGSAFIGGCTAEITPAGRLALTQAKDRGDGGAG